MMFTDCSSSTTSRLIHLNRRNGTFLLRRCVSQLRLRTTPSRRGCCTLYTRSSSPTPAISAGAESVAASKVIDGKAVAKKIRDEITIEVSRMKESIGLVPGLAVILVGDRKDSATYVRNKKKACESVGIKSFDLTCSLSEIEKWL